MTIIVVNAILWVWCSYVLAWFGRVQIADELSKTALASILGVVVAYAVKSTSENISKNGFVGKLRNKIDTGNSWIENTDYGSSYSTQDAYTECIDYPEESEPNSGGAKK